MEFVSYEEFQKLASTDKYYHQSRWDLYSKVQELLAASGATSVLELGAYRLPLVKGSDTMDRNDKFHPTYIQDAGETPWEIPDAHYDMFVALQVWEHLEGRQVTAFQEVKRVAREAILSFPYRWNCPKNPSHHAITEETIASWTDGETPEEVIVIPSTNNHRRIIYRYDFTKTNKLRNAILNKEQTRKQFCEEPIPTLRREPAECRFRTNVHLKDGQEFARCQFVENVFSGNSIDVDASVSKKVCEACIQEREPSPDCWNSVVSSLIFGQTLELGPPEEFTRELKSILRRAENGLRLVLREDRPKQVDSRSFGDCIYIGEKRDPKSSEERYYCLHPLLDDASEAKCLLCSEHQSQDFDDSPPLLKRLPLERKGNPVKSWMVGVTTSPRRIPTINRTLDSLRRAGWSSPWLFLDSAVDIAERHAHLPVTFREAATGAWPNYFLSLSELVMRAPDADAYMIIQDDALLTQSEKLRNYLEKVLWPHEDIGVISLFCSSAYDQKEEGWHELKEQWVWGAVAMIFSNASAWAFITDKKIIEHRKTGRFNGTRNIDVTIGEWLQRTKQKILFPVPSLSAHIGESSTLWEEGQAEGKRREERFIP
ncbi:class I SAM-dependent methyltransferase [Thalassoglobus polymorphus]|uniref:Uncharacterized protein n=1 Tax=Thalassoglobus polymorphus TaxID=2527994 RepID=A0A517QV93_9PLAN|nr:hypothetical protein [Thalassoglobus polymorphus]QDT35559.1 hypothetical protein Mal48_48370 [Thalassoglobus polymorphus]